ncbi:6-bladed beta-propeller [Candidatus Palauibacter sp.]|uniref:6-bladed beta-propeller n=1 Tax=Candidatus Palauibacter sp. TaxID=3101350 RepID=UPI003B52FAF5
MNRFRQTLPFTVASLVACSDGEIRVQASLDEPMTLERVRTVVRQDTTAATTWLHRPTGLQYDPVSGHLFGLEWADDRIVEFTTDGEFVGYFGRGGEGPGEIGNLRGFAVGTEHITVLDQGNGKLVLFDRDTREMLREIKFERLLRGMAAVSDTVLAVLPGPNGTLIELIHIDGRSQGSFGDASYSETADMGLSLGYVGDGLMLVLKPSIPEGRLYRLDGSLHAEVTFADVDHVLAGWREEFTAKMEQARLVDADGRRIIGGKLWVTNPVPLGEGSFFVTATPEDLDENPWELWVLDHSGRVTGRHAFAETWVRGYAPSPPFIYALGLRDDFGVHEYRMP